MIGGSLIDKFLEHFDINVIEMSQFEKMIDCNCLLKIKYSGHNNYHVF